MARKALAPAAPVTRGIKKSPTGISGLDEVTCGGLPAGRPTLVCGSAGAGKTMFALEFLVRGAMEFNEPGVFMAFEENAEELTQNAKSLGFDLAELQRRKKLSLDYVYVERSEIEETGEYDLDGLFIRLGYAIKQVGAKRVVLDTLETLFGGLKNDLILRAELRRLFRWLKEQGVTAIITAERGQGALTRHGLEEYISDCVIVLDHRVTEQVSTRRMRIVKYRGSSHGTNEYPFLIDNDGFSVVPITSIGLSHKVFTDRVSTGIQDIDNMLGGGVYRGSSVLISGTSGTGKTSFAASAVNAACTRGEKALYFSFEESERQIVRNGQSIGLKLGAHVQSKRLLIHARRATFHGLETHLAVIYKMVRDNKPTVVVIDPMTDFSSVASPVEVRMMMMRLVDFLKMQGVTAIFTSLTGSSEQSQMADGGISSIIDSWILLRNQEFNGERTRSMYIMKSRGMPHSNKVRDFEITSNGVKLLEHHSGGDDSMDATNGHTGRARVAAASGNTTKSRSPVRK